MIRSDRSIVQQMEKVYDDIMDDTLELAKAESNRQGPYDPDRATLHEPQGDLPPLTGNLGRSINHRKVKSGLHEYYTEGSDDKGHYGFWVEIGTSSREGLPFMAPGLKLAFDKVQGRKS